MCPNIQQSRRLLRRVGQVAKACHLENLDTVEGVDVDESTLETVSIESCSPFSGATYNCQRGIRLAAVRAGGATGAKDLDEAAETVAANV